MTSTGTHPIECTIDLAAPGREVGRLEIPKSTNTGGWAHQFIPIASISGGDGPTALVLGGNHGDEYEGQVASLKLFRGLEPAQVPGRVIVIPCLSPEASKAGTRLWPNGVNFNRSFPGRIDGPANEQLAHFISTALMPISDYVIDMHSGGTTAHVIPCSHMHVVDDAAQRKAMLDGMVAWNSDFHYLYIDVAGSGLLPVEAERQGKVVVTTELGGGGLVTRDVHELSSRGLANVLRHAGVLEGEVETRASMGKPDAVILDGRDPRTYSFAPTSGILETLVDVGESVREGQVVGRIYSLEHPEREPVAVQAPLDSVIVGIRAIAWTEQGDSTFIFGVPIEASELL